MSKMKYQVTERHNTSETLGIPFMASAAGAPKTPEDAVLRPMFFKQTFYRKNANGVGREDNVHTLVFKKSPEDARLFKNLLELMRGYAWAYKRTKEAGNLPCQTHDGGERVARYSNKSLNIGTVKIILPVVVELIENEYFPESHKTGNECSFHLDNPGRAALEALADLIADVDPGAFRFGTRSLLPSELADALKNWGKRRVQ